MRRSRFCLVSAEVMEDCLVPASAVRHLRFLPCGPFDWYMIDRRRLHRECRRELAHLTRTAGEKPRWIVRS